MAGAAFTGVGAGVEAVVASVFVVSLFTAPLFFVTFLWVVFFFVVLAGVLVSLVVEAFSVVAPVTDEANHSVPQVSAVDEHEDDKDYNQAHRRQWTKKPAQVVSDNLERRRGLGERVSRQRPV